MVGGRTLAALSRWPILHVSQSPWKSVGVGKICRITRGCSPAVVTKASYSTEEPYKKQSTNLKRVSDFERFLLVRFGYFPSKDQVPDELPRDRLARVWEKMRIFVNIVAMISVLVACYYMMILGRKDLEAGESYERRILQWHKDLKEEKRKEDEAKADKGSKDK